MRHILYCAKKADNLKMCAEVLRTHVQKFTEPWFPSIPIIPQISLVPQITYGVGFGAAGGCAYNQWLCIQQSVQVHIAY